MQQAAGASCLHWFSLPTLSHKSAPEGLEKYYTHHRFASQLRNSEPRESLAFIVSSKSLLLVPKGDSTSLLKVVLLQTYLGEMAQWKSNEDLALSIPRHLGVGEEGPGRCVYQHPVTSTPNSFSSSRSLPLHLGPFPSFIYMPPASLYWFTPSSPFAWCTAVTPNWFHCLYPYQSIFYPGPRVIFLKYQTKKRKINRIKK